jgi:hypothetical protein
MLLWEGLLIGSSNNDEYATLPISIAIMIRDKNRNPTQLYGLELKRKK